jgi:hypothetical protein
MPILLNSNAPGNSPRVPEAKQLSFLFLVKTYFIHCAPLGDPFKEKEKGEISGQKHALNNTLLQPMSLHPCS